MKYRITWRLPYKPGSVEPLVRGLSVFDSQSAAAFQVILLQSVPAFNRNRYYVEPI